MFASFSWSKWKRTLFALLFLVRYYLQMFLLTLRYKLRHTSRAEIEVQAQEYWQRFCQVIPPPHESVTQAMKVVKTRLEHESVTRTMKVVKTRLELLIFIEEPVTSKRQSHSSKLPATIQKIPRNKKAVLIALICAAILLTTLVIQSGLSTRFFHSLMSSNFSTAPQLAASSSITTVQQGPLVNASKALKRISQLEPDEYASQNEFDTWAYSACSTASMVEVFNAYGGHYRITDVLKVEAASGEITPQSGLMEDAGIAKTGEKFGFHTEWGENWSLEQVISDANAGHPVIVDWPPSLYDGGHIVVVIGGDANNVYLADTSLWNRRTLSHDQFMQWWAGFAAVMTPA